MTGIPDRAAFESMWMHQEAVIRLITVIGEAATQLLKLHPAFVSSHPGVPWEKMSTMRNRVVHDYFEIDLDIVWNTVKQDLPALATQIRVLLQEPGVRGTTAG
ncbi:MAG: DUF86 domain-containing protein [Nevskia sp.]|nr:DUF86 domain-containing protein [Nevskia sp.]